MEYCKFWFFQVWKGNSQWQMNKINDCLLASLKQEPARVYKIHQQVISILLSLQLKLSRKYTSNTLSKQFIFSVSLVKMYILIKFSRAVFFGYYVCLYRRNFPEKSIAFSLSILFRLFSCLLLCAQIQGKMES